MKGRTTLTVSLIDASPRCHQRHCTLVATIGSCIVQWGPGEHGEGQVTESGTDMNTRCAVKKYNIPLA